MQNHIGINSLYNYRHNIETWNERWVDKENWESVKETLEKGKHF